MSFSSISEDLVCVKSKVSEFGEDSSVAAFWLGLEGALGWDCAGALVFDWAGAPKIDWAGVLLGAAGSIPEASRIKTGAKIYLGKILLLIVSKLYFAISAQPAIIRRTPTHWAAETGSWKTSRAATRPKR